MQHAAHVAAYHHHRFFIKRLGANAAIHHRLSVAKYLVAMNLANNFPKVKGYKKFPFKKLNELEGSLEVWVDDVICTDDQHLTPPVIDAYQRDIDGRWVIVADFGYDVYTAQHHHLAMNLMHRGVCIYRHPC